MSEKIVSYVMSGGIGSRLWPLSREDFPKQFHDFSGHGSMLARTVGRLDAAKDIKPPIYLIASEVHANRLHQEINGLPLNGGRPVFEPVGRNTAAAVALASELTLREHGDTLVLVVPSDHEISTEEDFWATIYTGMKAAREGKIVSFGIQPDRPETGYGYIETGKEKDGVFEVLRFVEKPGPEIVEHYIRSSCFLWNSGIFLFSAKTMKQAFQNFAPDIWQKTITALDKAYTDISGTWLPFDVYKDVPSNSVDYAIMEHACNIALVPARFHWSDLGSWQSLLDTQSGKTSHDNAGNIIVGDVVAINCECSYLRSEGGLLSAVGLNNMAVVATADATFVAPVSQSQNVREIVAALESSGRLEAKFTPAPDQVPVAGAYAERVHHWLFDETLPLWSTRGVDERGGFYEALDFNGIPVRSERRMRTMARQIYAFAIAGEMGWNGPFHDLINHGLDFITQRGRTLCGGWVATFDADGHVKDDTEDLYDQTFVLLALAHAHKAGHKQALPLAMETFSFLESYLADKNGKGYFETAANNHPWRRSNPHMHLLETFLTWYDVTGDNGYLQQADRIVDLFCHIFFDSDNWTLGEYFSSDWQPAAGKTGDICEPGHHFEWASLLVSYARHGVKSDIVRMARKLYASAVANGLNRATGLAYNSVSRHGMPIDFDSRSWSQTEIIKAAIALDSNEGPDLKPEIEARVGRLFRWHIESAPEGLWVDMIDKNGRCCSKNVPASIFYHLVTALTQYVDFAAHVRAQRKEA